MFIKALIIGLISVFAMLDSRLLGRSNFERPLIVSTLVGVALGDITKGLMVGATLELMSMGLVNIGAAVATDMVLGSVIATAFAILSNTTAQAALTIALPIAVLGQLIGIVLRMVLSSLSHAAEHAIDNGKFKTALHYHIFWGTLLYSLMYFIPTFIAIYFGTGVVSDLVKQIPTWLTGGLTLASKILPAFGFALLMSTMLSKKTVIYLLLGFFITAYGGLSVTGVAIFAVILAFVLNEVLPKSHVNDNSGDTHEDDSGNSDDDLEEL
ncbi:MULTISPECIES: PTS sugar transporter subunit IIC [Lactobacillaceae]|uniref:PTS mannose/fructose/sorbose/N-acetylgalactosamine transporter subunit IIC n=1 Tax=Lactiplantibacillus plantarum TaxID=1590 RepID=UPI00077C5D43